MSGSWLATAEVAVPGWMGIPQEAPAVGRDEWVEERVAELRALWSATWEDEWASDLAEFLTSELNSQESGRLLSALCWSEAGPFLARVGVWVVPMTPISEWQDLGFEIAGFYSDGLGAGVQCVQLPAVDVDGEAVAAATAHYLFGDGEYMVQVAVGPTFRRLYLEMVTSLNEFIY
jgi:hypothetical protein